MSKKKEILRPLPDTLGLPHTGADSHAHLDSEGLFERLPEVLEHARNAGLVTIGQVFLNPADWAAHRDIFAACPGIFFLLGIHPCDAQQCTAPTLKAMREAFATDRRLRAVGEIGLDFFWDECPPAIQEEAFRVQLAFAAERNLPVAIHSRDAAKDSLRILEAEGFAGRPLLWHCFSGDAVAYLDRILANGWHVSIPGPVTYPANAELREAIRRIPDDRVMVETDCPYLAPLPWRGKPSETAFSAFTAAAAARERGEDPAAFWTLCGDNARRFFGFEGRGLCPSDQGA